MQKDLGIIGLALSGGGSRAIAFHLGCLRALHQLGLLERVAVISTISGGSVIGAAYKAHQGSFEEFDATIQQLLRRGLSKAMARQLFGLLGLRIIGAWLITSTLALVLAAIRMVVTVVSWLVPIEIKVLNRLREIRSPVLRFASRTSLLEQALNTLIFRGVRLQELSAAGPDLVVNATELRTGSAFRFARRESGSWRLGRLVNNDVTLAHAVAASAAYPLFLPAFDEVHTFEKQGATSSQRINLTDGGVYDNLGLSNFWPGRSADVSLNVTKIDTIICCSAGYGLRQDPRPNFCSLGWSVRSMLLSIGHRTRQLPGYMNLKRRVRSLILSCRISVSEMDNWWIRQLTLCRARPPISIQLTSTPCLRTGSTG
ncbi:patatin-like phospholipase family protein [Methylorubrum aminovorans]|uniref:patatin-like phospholipase family protein n=1 Tax=Methylorubrum aminovorans TaxID=269069 RepID=UPI0024E08852|nr:patatin-like phospholipase family protein [Methylorubrum aminovorans]